MAVNSYKKIAFVLNYNCLLFVYIFYNKCIFFMKNILITI